MSDNLSLYIYGAKDIRVENAPIPEPKAGQVKVAVHCTGICGSDITYYNKGGLWKQVVKEPSILGHECSGTVVGLGDGSSSLKLGDRVCLEPGVPCRCCDFCHAGRYHLCKSCIFYSAPPNPGFFTRYVCIDQRNVFKLPDNISYEEGAMMEPLSVAVHAVKRANVNVDSRVLIVGAGAIGLLTLLVARAYGASEICMADISPQRLEFAKKLGANYTVTPSGKNVEEDAKEVAAAMGGQLPDSTIECCGAESAIQLAINATEYGGQVILVGIGAPLVSAPLVQVPMREVDIKGCHRGCNTFPTAINLVSSGKVDLKPLITHHFPIDRAPEAFENVRAQVDGAIKVILHSAESSRGF